jgi:cell pole-organizing protein PopZ
VVRETVAQIVGDVAERLVREEIERIKRNIK